MEGLNIKSNKTKFLGMLANLAEAQENTNRKLGNIIAHIARLEDRIEKIVALSALADAKLDVICSGSPHTPVICSGKTNQAHIDLAQYEVARPRIPSLSVDTPWVPSAPISIAPPPPPPAPPQPPPPN